MSTGILDLSNGRFNNLTVKSYVGERPHKNVANVEHWKCECTCGRSLIVASLDLMSGMSTPSGCCTGTDTLMR